jgi:hypothetical protein
VLVFDVVIGSVSSLSFEWMCSALIPLRYGLFLVPSPISRW